MQNSEKLKKIISLNQKLNNLKYLKIDFLNILNGINLDEIDELPLPEFGSKGIFGIDFKIKLRRYGDEKPDFNLTITDLFDINKVEFLKLYQERLQLKIDEIEKELELIIK